VKTNQPQIPAALHQRFCALATKIAFASAALLLTSCGGGGGGDSAVAIPATTTISGRIADGYIRGAIIFWDCNDNRQIDSREISTISGVGGQYVIDKAPTDSCKLSAEIPSSAIDEDTNTRVAAPMFMRAMGNNFNFISPLTTIISLDILSESELRAKFGASSTINFSSDYIAAGAAGVAAHNVARHLAVSLQKNYSTLRDDLSEGKNKLIGAFQLIPSNAFSSTQRVSETSLNSYSSNFAEAEDEIAVDGGYARYEIDPVKYANLNSVQKSHVYSAYQIYLTNTQIISRGENMRWSSLPSDLRVQLKQKFASEVFTDSTEVANLISERQAFLAEQKIKVSTALGQFRADLKADAIQGAIDVSATYFDGMLSIADNGGLASAKRLLGKGLSSSVKIKKLANNLSKYQTLNACFFSAFSLIYELSNNSDQNQSRFYEPQKIFDLIVCGVNELKNQKYKNAIKTAITSVKGGNAIDALVLVDLESFIAMSEFLLAAVDLFGIDASPGASQGFGAIKVALAGVKAIALTTNLRNTNDEAQLKFDAALVDMGRTVDQYLENYAVAVFDLRLTPYFRKVLPYSVAISGIAVKPLETTVRATLSMASHIPLVPTVQWFFGDGNTKTGLSTSHIYSQPGKYTLTAYAQADTELAIKVYEASINVSCPTGTNFSAAEGCVNISTTVVGQVSTVAGGAEVRGFADGAAALSRFNLPMGVTVDASGNVYVADTHNHTIRKITPAGIVSTFAGLAEQTGLTDGVGANARFTFPTGVAIDSFGNVYVADSGNHAIRKITAAGAVSTLAGNGLTGGDDGVGSQARFLSPYGIVVDAFGNIIVADSGNHTVRKITTSGAVSTLAGLAGGYFGFANGTGSAARFYAPYTVTSDAAGNIYVADSGNNLIRKITPNGTVSTFAGAAGQSGSTDGIGGNARFNDPYGITIDAVGNIYVTDRGNYTIRKITANATVSTLAGSVGQNGSTDGVGSAALFFDPRGIFADSTGNIFVADRNNHTIRKIR
jgi:PKD repeat protein